MTRTQEETEMARRAACLRRTLRFAWGLVFVLVVLTLPIVLPPVEAFIYPPIKTFKIENVEPTEKGVWVSGYLVKQRGHCKPEILEVHTRNLKEGIADVVFFADARHPIVGKDRSFLIRALPAGKWEWGPFFLKKPKDPGDLLVFTMVHDCHFLWDIRTELLVTLTSNIFVPEAVQKQLKMEPLDVR